MIRRFTGALAAALGLLAGLWLMLAPVALGTQPAGLDSDWNDPTITEFTTGAVIAVVGLVGLVAFAMSIRDEVVRRGLVAAPAPAEVPQETAPAAVPAAGPAGPAAPAAGDEQVADLLAPLVRALADDMGPRATPNGAPRGTGTPYGGDYR
jgi:pyruvate/2-oxoglutarate dehydrogenase complex dihydrolipoamide acyltransferase (E2) component